MKRKILVLTLTFVCVFGFLPVQPVNSVAMTDAEMAMLDAAQPAQFEDTEQKRGNGFVRALKAPFKAIGRLFGRGGNKNKLQRLSEKDVKKFEAAGVTRVVDARSVPAPPEASAAATVETAPAAPPEIVNPSPALEHLERGRELLHSNDLNGAIASLSLAASLDPELKEAHNLLGVAYETKGVRNLALKAFEAALKGKDDHPEHLNNMGYVLIKNGEYDAAIKYLKRAVKLAPTAQRFWNNLGMAQAHAGKFDDAYKSFEKAVGEFEGHMNVASRLQRQGFDKQAIKHLEKARALKPETLEILARLAVLYGRTGKQEKALEARNAIAALQALANAPAQEQPAK